MSDQIKYAPAILKGKTDAELLALLKQSWGYAPEQPLIVFGELLTVQGLERPHYFLTKIRSINDTNSLEFPIDLRGVSHNIYIETSDGKNLVKDRGDALYFKAQVKFSSDKEREKSQNPFALQTVPRTIKILEELPIESTKISGQEGTVLLERSILDILKQKNRAQLEASDTAIRSALEQDRQILDVSLAELQSTEKQVKEQLASNSLSLQEAREQLGAQQQIMTVLVDNYEKKKVVIDSHLSRLNNFVRSKVDILHRLGLIGDMELQIILRDPQPGSKLEGYDFEEDFELDDGAAIAHIQAFLHAKGIYYKQSLLMDFLALLRTQDLIILAGDSGSGKTNLVKSFAEAIGGKAIIIPVKPNWTSTEDLLGYYNPLEKRYITTQFLDALIEAENNPQIPYLICLDEMNLARVEYYFADFLSLLEERNKQPKIFLYSDTEASHVQHEYDIFLKLTDEVLRSSGMQTLTDFTDLLKDEQANAKLHQLCGFRDGESLLKYHSYLRRALSGLIRTPSTIELPANVRFIGAINVDETTHYLSPKILDRAHVIRFTNPLLFDWQAFEDELQQQDRDLSMHIRFSTVHLGERTPYPEFDRSDALVVIMVEMAKDYLSKLGVEFGLRTVRQARNYAFESRRVGIDEKNILNNFVLHKVLPKLMLDGSKKGAGNTTRKDVLYEFRDFLELHLNRLGGAVGGHSCIVEMDGLLSNAEFNDWAVNYWAR